VKHKSYNVAVTLNMFCFQSIIIIMYISVAINLKKKVMKQYIIVFIFVYT
jgi:hypothetical protein